MRVETKMHTFASFIYRRLHDCRKGIAAAFLQ